MLKFDTIALNEIFFFPSINGLTEQFIRDNKGDIPVYGGSKNEVPIGYIKNDIPNVKYFENCLAWNREGSVGYVFYHKGKFSTNDHHRPLVLKKEYSELLDKEYLRLELEQLLLSQGFRWSKTASKEKVSGMFINIPINDDGSFDIDIQKRIVEKYNRVASTQNQLKIYYEKLQKSNVQLQETYPFKTLYLSDDVFSLEIGKRILKKEVQSSGIPVYSANPNQLFGYTAKSNISDFSKPSILWGIDGNFEFGYIPANVEFATTDHCGRITIESNNIISEFVYYQLQESKNLYGFNRVYRASLKNITMVSVNIPIDTEGNFDIEAQQEMLRRYKKIESIKTDILNLLITVIKSAVDY